MGNLLIVNVGSAPEEQLIKYGDFEQWAQQAIGETELNVVFHDGIHCPLPDYSSLSGVIVMGSLSMVTDRESWMLKLSKQLIELSAQNVPLLGICFGHQLIAYTFGGDVGYNPNGLEIGSVPLTCLPACKNDPIFSMLPDRFEAQTVHYQSVLALPPGAVHLAQSQLDKNHAFRVGKCAWGVQFHPEFSAEIMRDMLNNFRDTLDKDELIKKSSQIISTEYAQQVLVRFVQLCNGEHYD
ncbi:GMP synthase [Vibrio sp. HA2012]|uniref:glutamine amidotransferase n=1 Tax=Vibrio sp. HA2012 TaxID=1971595 RepID=UPI000C2C7B1B|nr:glutamine amidotransferase [Vibrio sp. HA2012]PJC87465.1 GMP synthase [Vibrio sp. HA2012]